MISVIILNWNGKHHLEVCLNSLAEQSYTDFELILVDNASTDGSVEYIENAFPQVQVLALDKNLGFAAGNNAGIKIAQGEFIALLNNDTEAHSDWLASLVQTLIAYPDVGFCASTMLDFEQRNIFDSAGLGYSRYGLAFRWKHGATFNPVDMQPRPVFAACGGAMIIRKSVLDTIGLFDPDFYMYNEDVDLCFRSQLSAKDGIYVPKAIVYHKQGASSRVAASDKHWARLRIRNRWWVFMKNMPTPLLVRGIPYALYGLVRMVGFGISVGMLDAYLAGMRDALRAWPQIRQKRRAIASLVQVPWQQLDKLIEHRYPSKLL